MTFRLKEMKYRLPEDDVFAGGHIAMSFPRSYLDFMGEEAARLQTSRSAFIRAALDFYRDHLEEARSLALPAVTVTPALLRERRLIPRIPVGAA